MKPSPFWTAATVISMAFTAYFMISGEGDLPNWAYFVAGCGNATIFCIEVHRWRTRRAGGRT